MTQAKYKKMLAGSGGVTDSANKKSVENPPGLDKKEEEILDKAWKNVAKTSKRNPKPIAT